MKLAFVDGIAIHQDDDGSASIYAVQLTGTPATGDEPRFIKIGHFELGSKTFYGPEDFGGHMKQFRAGDLPEGVDKEDTRFVRLTNGDEPEFEGAGSGLSKDGLRYDGQPVASPGGDIHQSQKLLAKNAPVRDADDKIVSEGADDVDEEGLAGLETGDRESDGDDEPELTADEQAAKDLGENNPGRGSTVKATEEQREQIQRDGEANAVDGDDVEKLGTAEVVEGGQNGEFGQLGSDHTTNGEELNGRAAVDIAGDDTNTGSNQTSVEGGNDGGSTSGANTAKSAPLPKSGGTGSRASGAKAGK